MVIVTVWLFAPVAAIVTAPEETAIADHVIEFLPVEMILLEEKQENHGTIRDMGEKSHLEEANSSMFNYSLRRNLRFPERKTSLMKNANLARLKVKPNWV